ncbi:MarR family winged helix-turn-helix transcriptional regulator [Arcobacter cloacae]|uniref:MarR family transcriptional regulator n=1 Tax=Arcobacter cloacae TaxID=1054034 RepID=A0A4V1LVE8_9BACT|nr:MarR family transcriptional regulator [Arcobacter cloacae]RXJ83845.1 MarR family transcriptional regulator [Arcobacter cloacae]
MNKKYIDKFYNSTAKKSEYEIFNITLPINLLYKDMFNETEHFLKANYDLLHSHIDVLASLYFNGNSLSPTELYDAMLFSSGGMTKILNKLEERSLIKREPSVSDKRSTLICLTKEGEKVVKEAIIKIAKAKEEMFEVLNEKEKEDLKNILSKVIYSQL